LDVELEVERTLAVIGPSGAGKTTLLRLIAGLDRPESGLVECDGERWAGGGAWVPPERRRVGFLFQDYALFPHMSVHANVAFEARRDVGDLLERMGIAHLATARPGRLSGGERQRVALARALAIGPRALLLDEPLAALDPSTRSAVAAELARVVEEEGVPTIVVTHSYEEAVTFADEVAVMDRGAVVQRGSAAAVVEAPASAFVAEFAGVNYLLGTAAGTTVRLDGGETVRTTDPAEGRVAVLVAPWEITLAPGDAGGGDSALNRIPARVDRVVVVGNRARVTLGRVVAEVTPESVERLSIEPGLDVVAVWKATATRVVPAARHA
jgi:molybdate transport system ATP-binding protein